MPGIERLRADRVEFWQRVSSGLAADAAAEEIGLSSGAASDWMRQAGGMIPTHLLEAPSGRYLDLMDRAQIAAMHGSGASIRQIAARVGRDPSTISRELRRNQVTRGYDPRSAQRRAEARLLRPKPMKLSQDPALHAYVQSGLNRRWSPQQIVLRMRADFPDDERMRVSHETIYRSLYVQARGTLKRELVSQLRSGKTIRKPRQTGGGGSKIKNMVNISERPAEAKDRAIPGHWEGDLIIGANNRSQIGTLVERTTRYCLLLHLPIDATAASVAEEMIAAIRTLPTHLMRSVTWDQGSEMGAHERITLDTNVKVYFCDPRSPWQRGTNENTNGLLRQYFPKGTDLSVHSREHLDHVAAELNGRPRKTLNARTPAEAFEQLLLTSENGSVATTP